MINAVPIPKEAEGLTGLARLYAIQAARSAEYNGSLPASPPRAKLPADFWEKVKYYQTVKVDERFLPPTKAKETDYIRHLPCRHLGDIQQAARAKGCKKHTYWCNYEGHDFERCVRHYAGEFPEAVRGCMDCPHHVPEYPFTPTRSMSVDALAECFAQGRREFPEGYTKWEAFTKLMPVLATEAIADCPPAPEREGRGVVTCGGGKYSAGLYVLVKMLRGVGCDLPVQIWHQGDGEPVGEEIRTLPGVEVINAKERLTLRQWGGWQLKMPAVMNSGFKEVLFIDADAYPVTDPTPWFDDPRFVDTGLVVWPDGGGPRGTGRFRPKTFGLKEETLHCPAVNGGHYLIDVVKAWKVLNLHAHYDSYSEYYYSWRADVGGFGDQDMMRAAVSKLRAPFGMFASELVNNCRGTWVQAGPDGKPGIAHRVRTKLGPPDERGRTAFGTPLRRTTDAPGERKAWGFFREWCGAVGVEVTIPDCRLDADTAGVAIGSYGQPGVVALNIALIREHCGDIPILVVDDCSRADWEPIRQRFRNVEIYESPKRLGHGAGDIAKVHKGLEWAKEKHLEYLVCLSQRFIIDKPNWLEDAILSLDGSGKTLLGQRGIHQKHRFPLRTEAMILEVDHWATEERLAYLRNHKPGEVPGEWGAESVEIRVGALGEDFHPWDLFGEDRFVKHPGILWRCANDPAEYHALAKKYGVNLGERFTTGEWKDVLGNRYLG